MVGIWYTVPPRRSSHARHNLAPAHELSLDTCGAVAVESRIFTWPTELSFRSIITVPLPVPPHRHSTRQRLCRPLPARTLATSPPSTTRAAPASWLLVCLVCHPVQWHSARACVGHSDAVCAHAGTLKAWCHILEHYGTLPLATVMAPAIRHATNGFGASECVRLFVCLFALCSRNTSSQETLT